MRAGWIVLLAIILSGHAMADEPTKVDDIRKFFALSNVAERMMVGINQNLELQKRANPQIPAEFWSALAKEIQPRELIERMVVVYDKRFTHEQIRAWIKFFESEAGQVFLKNQSAVLEETSAAGNAYVLEISDSIARRLKLK